MAEPTKLASVGWNPYFILEPGHYRVLRGGQEEITMTVLHETKMMENVEARVSPWIVPRS